MTRERLMQLVNLLFLIWVAFPNRTVSLAASLAWLLYLIHGIRRSESRAMRVVYGAILLIPLAAMLLALRQFWA